MTETREVYEQRRQDVADKIVAEPAHFNMAAFISGVRKPDADPMCGTTLCIAGWAALQVPGVTVTRKGGNGGPLLTFGDAFVDAEVTAIVWLGLTDDGASDLFYGRFNDEIRRAGDGLGLAVIAPAEAVAALMAAPYICDGAS